MVDLRKIPVFVITCDERRRVRIGSQLASVGITPTFIEGIKCSPGIIGCGLSHLKILSRHCSNMPFLVLEDDCALTEAFLSTIELPLEADAIYLGVSNWGARAGQSTAVHWGTRATCFDEKWLRIHNMCSTHAILYRGLDHLIDARRTITDHIFAGIPFDIGLALIQNEHIVLTPNEPFFYQSAEFGGNQADTEHALIPQFAS